jgi:type IV pilus assembly protein PilB
LNDPAVKITTVEDPVEYVLTGINQQNVLPQAGLTCAAAIRSQVRQDPDVIMVGELRDLESASLLVHAALTGQRVLTCLHAPDTCAGVRRLLDMGIEPFLANSALAGIWSQRLVRTICPTCREEVAPLEWFPASLRSRQGMKFFRGRGCEQCRQSGWQGRTAIHELLTLGDEMKKVIARDPGLAELREGALRSGLVTLKEDGLAKAAQGVTAVEEVIRVCADV